jgi:alpha-1,2-mannosyltransferase
MVAERTGSAGTLAEGSEESVVPESGEVSVRRRRILQIAGVALAALVFDFIFAERHGFFDLHVYHGAINYWVHSGGSIYDFVLPFSTYGFTYPPFAAW